MSTVTIYGASDDLVEVDGAISEEFTYREAKDGPDAGMLVAVSDGTLLRITYTQDGLWRIDTLREGASALTLVPAKGPDTDQYSDKVTLDGPAFAWVVVGNVVAYG